MAYPNQRPQDPGSPGNIDQDNMETDIGGGAYQGYQPQGSGQGFDNEETEIGRERQAYYGGRILDDDLDETEIGRGARADDETEIDTPDTGILGFFIIKEGRKRGKSYKIKAGDTIGRKDGDLVLDDPKVSTPHVRFTVEQNQFVLWDCGSTNGTFVNGERIRAATPLKENDTVKIGDSLFVLKVLE